MSNVKEAAESKETKPVGHAGNRASTTPSVGKMAKNLDPDINPWERQPGESKPAYDAFKLFLDDEKRVVNGKGSSAYQWSADWSWGYRALQYDLWLDRIDAEEMVRYRRTMNQRQRQAASLAQQKVVQWLIQLDPTTLSPSEAARWLEVAVRIERLAGGDASERIAVHNQGPIAELTAEQVSEALQGLQSEIQRLVERA